MSRFLTVMGSGETAPTMVKVHRRLLERVGGPAVLLDTPYGFQENADDISARAQDYFAQSVGWPIGVASFRSADAGPAALAGLTARLREARYVFAGPGSPTYALRQWAGTPLPGLLAEKLQPGATGAVTFASAAALTVGIATVPVYEIYKAGIAPHWLDGLDLLAAATGLRAAVIPHFDNAEGGHHDTRFCYLGERRLARMEQALPEGAFVLGVDEHTGCIFDLDAATVEVVGLGALSVRAHGVTTQFPTGTTLGLDDIRAAAEGRQPATSRPAATAGGGDAAAPPAPTRSPLLAETDRLDAEFGDALRAGDIDGAVATVLELDGVIEEWSADTLDSDEPDRARAVLHAMVVRLGEAARDGVRDPREVVGPFVDTLLAVRGEARAAKDWAMSDRIRDDLAAAGVEVRDTPAGQEWHLGP